MSSSITVRGFAATQPKFNVVADRFAVSSFRLGSSERRYNRSTGAWENGPTSWYTVSCFRDLASNVYASVNKGDPVIVTGRLKVSEWSAGAKSGVDVEIEADGIGHDFRWGKALGFVRPKAPSKGGRDDGEERADEEQAPPPDDGLETATEVWPVPGMALGSTSVADAGEPTSLQTAGLDEDSGEAIDAGLPPF
jgi:single-strand DNA-binding protein